MFFDMGVVSVSWCKMLIEILDNNKGVVYYNHTAAITSAAANTIYMTKQNSSKNQAPQLAQLARSVMRQEALVIQSLADDDDIFW